jgi:hypothetical protein
MHEIGLRFIAVELAIEIVVTSRAYENVLVEVDHLDRKAHTSLGANCLSAPIAEHKFPAVYTGIAPL